MFSLMPEKKIKLYSRMTLELGFTEQIPKTFEDNSEHFRAFEKQSWLGARWYSVKENEPKKPGNIFGTEKFKGLFLRNEHQLISWELYF